MSAKTRKTSWKKGQSGNPQGRPKKGTSISDEMRRLLESVAGDGKTTYKQMLVKATMKSAVKGNVQAQKLIWERMDPPGSEGEDEVNRVEQITGEISRLAAERRRAVEQ